MPTPLIPQEIYLLERYSSLEYFGKMRDAWRDMLEYAEDLLQRFNQNLPPKYRKRPLPEQPDIVWGERVLPNFRFTMELLDSAYIKLTHGEYEALGRAHAVTGDIRGQSDFWSGWMDEVEAGAEAKYLNLLYKAHHYAKPIAHTSAQTWEPGELTTDYQSVINEPLDPPATWPSYRLNKQVTVQSGERTPQTGIYLPDADNSFPALLIKSDDDLRGAANEALVLIDPTVSPKREYRPVLWTLVEHVSEGSNHASPPSLLASARLRAEAGKICPQTGYWFTPAQLHSRRHFKEGDIMPAVGSDYGATIWQWDTNQA